MVFTVVSIRFNTKITVARAILSVAIVVPSLGLGLAGLRFLTAALSSIYARLIFTIAGLRTLTATLGSFIASLGLLTATIGISYASLVFILVTLYFIDLKELRAFLGKFTRIYALSIDLLVFTRRETNLTPTRHRGLYEPAKRNRTLHSTLSTLKSTTEGSCNG